MSEHDSALGESPKAEPESTLRIGIVTLFPELFGSFVETSMVGRAVKSGNLDVLFEQLREHGLGVHKSVDDTPYGGGPGMVLRVDTMTSAIEALSARMDSPRKILLSPQGKRFEQADARRLSAMGDLLFICGRYEGFDERVRGAVDEELSLGDFVMTGGEVAAMAMIEAIARLRPAVLGNAKSAVDESFSGGALEYPQYTRPVEFRGVMVPDILRSGDHGKIDLWRKNASAVRTAERRPDLCDGEKTNETS